MGVDSAIISEPNAKFVNIVNENNLIQYLSKSFEYLEIAKEAMSEIEEDWDEEIRFYKFKKNAHKNLKVYPYNQGLAIGSVYIELYKALLHFEVEDKSFFYLKRVNQIGAYFKKALILDEAKNRYLWRYAPQSYYEDSSHASIDINFAIKAYQNNLIFDKQDMEKFANTIIHAFNEETFARYIDGKDLPEYTSWYGLTCMKLVELAKFSNRPKKMVKKCKDSVEQIISNRNILLDMPYQFYTQLVYGIPVLYKEMLDL